MEQTTILIIDDHVAFAETLGSPSPSNPIGRVSGSRRLAEGAQLAAAHQPDVILADVVLPDDDSLDHVVALREASPDSAVIILTGSVDDRILADVVSARPDGFTPKSSPLRDVFPSSARRRSRAGRSRSHTSRSPRWRRAPMPMPRATTWASPRGNSTCSATSIKGTTCNAWRRCCT